MKIRMLFVLAIAVAFTACDSDADFATPADQSANALNTQAFISDSDGPQGLAACMEVSTNHEMTGVGRLNGSYYSWFFEPSGTYEVHGTGMVTSNSFKDGETQIRFTYTTQNSMISGSLHSQFKTGEVLTQKFEGIASKTINGKKMTLTVNLSSANLDTGAEAMELQEGMISITLPKIPNGAIALTAQTRGMYCTQD